MDCSEFRDCHCAFIDDTLAGVELVRMQRHLVECADCAALDVKIRRSLMAFRSLPTIEPSPDFRERLERRLHECRSEQEDSGYGNFRAVATVGAVASMLMMGYVGASFRNAGVKEDIVLPPVIALAERPEPPAVTTVASAPAHPSTHRQPMIVSQPMRAIAASVSAGMPLWPVAVFAEQAPLHFATLRETH
jgi:hypothetical protein